MTVIQSAYDLLVILTLADGELDPNETRVIAEFLADNQDGSLDPRAANQRLMNLDAAGVEANFEAAISAVKNGASLDARKAILEFGIDLIMSDGELSDEENALIVRLGEAWGVHLQPLVARAMGIE